MLIESAKQKNREKGQGIYYERHHIVPRCLGGSNSTSNLVLLTAIEHYNAHRLLALANPGNHSLSHGWWRMCHLQDGTIINEIEHEQARQAHASALSSRLKGKPGKPHSEQTKQKLSAINSGKTIPRDIVDKITKANTGKKRTAEQVENLRKGQQNKESTWIYVTPEGEFASFREAAESNLLSNSNLIYRCTNNTKGYSRKINPKGKQHNAGRKSVWVYCTPVGDFSDYKIAASENNIKSATLTYRCLKGILGFTRNAI